MVKGGGPYRLDMEETAALRDFNPACDRLGSTPEVAM